MSRRSLLLETCEDRILCNAAPNVTLQAPANAKIGDTVTVQAKFDNSAGTNAGYGPYIDLVVDKTGADGNDGLTFQNATYLGANVTATVLTFDAAGHATHPYAKDSAGDALIVNGSVGDQLIVLQLPFGSFTPQQPPAAVNITFGVSTLADAGVDLSVAARGGFQFGNDSLNNPQSDPSIVDGSFSTANITPTLFTVSKSYLGPEGETATGPNYLRQYQVDVDIASGQTIANLQLNDLLPSNLQFFSDPTHQVEVLKNGVSTGVTGSTTPSATTPGGTLSRTIASVTGDSTTAADATLRFWAYVPRIDSTSAPILNATSGDDVTVQNNASASGTWTPIDTRDAAGAVSINPAGAENTITAKSLATQKTVAFISDVGAAGVSAGDVLEYTINVQVSDYFSFDNLSVTDLLSDGQQLDQSFDPTFSFNEHGASSAGADFGSANWTAAQNFTGAVANGPNYTIDPAANNGTTSISFRISDEMVTRGFNADLMGGGVPNGGGAAGNNLPLPFGATTATIKFRVIVQDQYADTGGADPQLSPRDVVSNAVTVNGNVLNNATLAENGQTEADTSGTSLTVSQPSLTKSVYAINGVVLGGNAIQVIRPGDVVTYRLQYTIPTGDIQDFKLTDFLPLPIFDVGTFNLTYSGAAPTSAPPPANVLRRGATDTFTNTTGLAPAITEPGGNALDFSYGSFSNSSNTAQQVDLLFSVVVNNQPFADGLFLTNQARATEGIARNGVVDTDAIVQFVLGEPDVEIYKGVVAENGAGFTLGGIAFNGGPGSSFSGGPIDTAAELAAIDASNATNADASDVVRFAIVAQNTGRADAFDVSIEDTLVPGYVRPASIAGLNLVVRRGDGTLLTAGTDYTTTYNNATGRFTVQLVDNYNVGSGTGGLNVGSTGASGTPATDGSNAIVIFYDATLAGSVSAGAVETNTATLTNYSNVESGTDFTTEDQTNTATVTVAPPALSKQVTNTEVIDARGNGVFGAVVGETVTFTLTLTVPEGQTSSAVLTDTLDGGLSLVSVDSVTASSGNVTFTGNPMAPTVSNGGRTVVYNFGDITNTASSNGTPETITITYRAVVLDVAGNQAGTQLGNTTATLAYESIDQPGAAVRAAAVIAAAPTQKVTVVEPTIITSKTAVVNGSGTTGDAGDPVTYTITLAHAGSSADAYDLDLSDSVPSTIDVTGFTVNDSSGAINASSFDLTGNVLTTVAGGFDFANTAGHTLTITISGTLAADVSAGQVIANTATTRWTSEDGTPSARSGFDGTSVERTGADGVLNGGTLNDYRTQGTANVTVLATATKTIVSTSEASTSGSTVVPGEIIRYRLVSQIGEGTSLNTWFFDDLRNGLTFLNDGTAKVAFVSNDAGMTSSTLAGAGLNVTGSAGNLASITPTFALPDTAVSTSSSANADAYANGTDVFFKLGDIVNSDRDGDAEYVVIEFNAIVSNAAGSSNNAGATANGGSDANDVNANTYALSVNNTTVATSAAVNVTVAEPNVSIAKALTITPSDAGDQVRYTITLTNAGGATAYDLAITDLLDNDLDFSSGTVTDSLSSGSFTTTAVGSQTRIDYALPNLNAGQTVVITVTGVMKSTVSAGETFGNAATVTYTSLPGSGTVGGTNTTGSTTGAAGSATGERTGSGAAPNDYTATSSTVNLTLATPTVDKLDLSDTTDAVGEQVVYYLNVTLPEGITENLSITDALPPGLTPLSFEIITNGSTSGMTYTRSASFNGSGLTAGVTNISGGADGQDLVLNLGNITTTDDNVATNNNFLIRVVAQVSDTAPAINGASLQNLGQLSYRIPTNSASSDPATGTAGSSTDNTSITVVEPKLQIVKTVDDAAPEAGQTLNYTLTISHTAASTATAFDLRLRDVIPAGLTLSTGSILINGLPPPANGSTGSLLDLSFDQLAVGSTLTITYQATVSTSRTFTATTQDNNARLFWDSLAADDANAVFTGSTDSAPDRDYGPTAGYTEAPTPAPDDPAQDTARVTVNSHAISGRVYLDANGNGTFTAGESGIAGVLITLTGTDQNGITYTLTTTSAGAGGTYSFGNLVAGTYTLTESQPSGFVDALESVGTNYGGTASSTLNSNTITTLVIPDDGAAAGINYNFGETAPSSLAGTTYVDADNNGVLGGSETRLPNVTIALTGTDAFGQSVSLSTLTDTNGDYAFSGLRPGTYTLTETQPAGYLDGRETAGVNTTTAGTVNNSTNSNTISLITLGGGQDGTGNLFGELEASSLAGVAYVDADNNGLVGTGEQRLSGVTVILSGTDDRGQSVSSSTTTAGDGSYSFTILRPGSYTLTETQPTGFLDGRNTIGTGTTGATTTNNPPSDVISTIGLVSNTNAVDFNFGELKPSSLSGTVFRDDNNDGAFNGTDAGLGGVTITLTGTNDLGAIAPLTAVTAGDGSYSFSNLRPGTYTVTETQPGAFVSGRNTAGATGGSASAPPGNTISGVILASDTQSTGNTFAELTSATVSGRVFNDRNNNGSQQAGEPGLLGVAVRLTGTDAFGNAVNVLTSTDSNGDFNFAGLTPSDASGYTLTETQPAAFLDGRETAGPAGGTVVNGSDSQTIIAIPLAIGANATGNLFAEIQRSSLGGVVYRDLDNDGVNDGDPETGVAGVTVHLTGTDDRGAAVNLTTGTAADGSYTFANLRPSDLSGYVITEDQPAGLLDGLETVGSQGGSASTNDVIITAVVVPNTIGTANNFGELPPSRLDGIVYRDDNNDGLRQAGEPLISGVTVTLTGTDDLGAITPIVLSTNGSGAYSFVNLRPGTYTLTESQPAGLLDGQNTAGTLAGTTVNNPLSDVISGINVSAGQIGANYRFGELAPSSLSGTVYADADNDGQFDSGETGLAGVAVALTGTDDLGNAVSLNTTSAADGSYAFTGLRPGTYAITETQAAGYLDGRDAAGTAGGTVGNPPSDAITSIVLSSHTDGAAYLFGEVAPSSLSGSVYVDLNRNGSRDAGESAIPNVTITLTGTDDLGQQVTLTTLTDGAGAYSFAGLRPSAAGYTLTETQPSNYADGPDQIGTQLGVAGNDVLTTAAIVPGTLGTENNFSEFFSTQLAKSIVATSEVATTGSEAAVGETIRYRITATVPFGTLRDFQFEELLPPGSVFLNDGTAAVGFVSASGSSVTSSFVSGGGMTSIGAPSALLPDNAVSSSATANSDVYGSGDHVFFKLGDLANSDADAATLETVVLEFNARVVDEPANESGSVLSNQFAVRFDTTGDGVADNQAQAGTPPPVNITVVEPKLVTTKSVDDPTPDLGQVLNYHLTITHLAGQSTEDAFDVLLRDGLPPGLTLDVNSILVSGATLQANNSTASGLSLDFDQLARGGQIDIFYQATVDNTLANVGASLANNARLYWDSLAGDEPVNAVLENTGDATPDRDYGAQPGVIEDEAPASPAADDPAQDTVLVQVNTNFIAGTVYQDLNADGAFTAAEPPIAGVTVHLTGTTLTGLDVDLTTVTGPSGQYTFGNLAAGNYTLTEIQPAGFVDALETAGAAGGTFGGQTSPALDSNVITQIAIPAQSATFEGSYDFGENSPGLLAGNVYLDDDNDGQRDAGEEGLRGVGVTVTGTDLYGQSVTLSTTTLNDGSYVFSGLRPGDYTLTEDDGILAASYLDGRDTVGTAGGAVAGPSPKRDVLTVTLPQGAAATNYNFGELRPAALAGSVYLDVNEDGSRDPGESGVSGVTVTLNGTDDRGLVVSLSASTAADGSYQFTGLRPGTYSLTESQPSAFGDGLDAAGTLGGNVTNDTVTNIGVQAGQSGTGYTFGERLAGITGRVFLDANQDSVDNAETGLGGVALTLLDAQGNTVGSTITAANGSYAFGGLAAGSYTVTQAQPSGYGSSTANAVSVLVPAGGSTRADFGETVSTLTGRVYLDADRSGTENAGDSGLGGIAVSLSGNDVNGLAVNLTTNTAADGSYAFSGLLAGTYTLTETQPAGYGDGTDTVGTAGGTASPPDSIIQIALGEGVAATDYTFGEIVAQPAGRGGLAGTVYYDRDANGVIGAAEPGLAGVTITLFDQLGNRVAATLSGADGRYAFNDLAPGTYQLVETQPATYGSSTPNVLGNLTVAADSVAGGLDFGETSGSLAGAVYLDLNQDGQQQAGETGIAGVTLTLTGTDYDGTAVNRTVLTGADGTYVFSQLLGGTYTVTETQPNVADGLDTAGTAGGSLGNDVVTNIGLGGGVNATGYQFGETPAALSGTVFVDANRDGTLGAGEAGLANVVVTLRDAQGNTVATQTTAADGTYRFENLLPADYTVLEGQPIGYASSTPNTFTVTVPPAGLAGQDFGEVTGSLAGRVFLDADGSNSLTAGDSGLGGVSVTLSGTDANGAAVNRVATTAADGSYLFSGLLAGNYTVRETQPSAYADGGDTLGSAGGTNSQNDEFSGIGFGAGVQATGYNFGETLPLAPGLGAITGTVYLDRVRDGLLNAGEPGLSGVRVELYDSLGGFVGATLTGADGGYVFNGLTPGTGYQVVEITPVLNGSSTPDTLTADVRADEVTTGLNFGDTLGRLTGHVFLDRDASATRTSGDGDLAGVQITLTGQDLLGNSVSRNVLTAADGSYAFDDLTAGTYDLTETQPAAYLDGADSTGTLGGINSGSDSLTGIAVNGGAQGEDYNFGETGGSLGGVVFHDRGTRNGVQDPGEEGVGSVTLQLRDAQNRVVALVQTAADGSYTFSNLALGSYTVVELQPAAYGSSTPNQVAVTLTDAQPGQADFGETLGSLSGVVFHDRNNSGLQDAGEPPIGNVAVTLTGTTINGASVTLSTVTDSLGAFVFNDLDAGTYTLTEAQPGGFVDGRETVGTAGGNPLVNDVISGIGLGAGRQESGYLYGERTPVDLTIAKTDELAEVRPGQQLTYSVTLRNDGLQDANGVIVTDQFPSSVLDFVSASDGGVYDPVARTITWQLGEVTGRGEEIITLTITARVKEVIPAGAEYVTNLVTVREDGSAGPEISDTNNRSFDRDTVVAAPDLFVSPPVQPSKARVGDTLTYTLTGGNAGQQTAEGVVITQVLPPGIRFVSASNGGVFENGRIVWHLDELVPGERFQFTVRAVVETAAGGQKIVHTVTIDDRYHSVDDPILENNFTSGFTRIEALPPTPNLLYAYDSFHNFAFFDFGFEPYSVRPYTNPTDIYRPPLLPLAPIYSGAADPGATLVVEILNANGESIGQQTVMADAGGNWLVTFPNSIICDYPASVRIVELPAPYSPHSAAGRNLRNYFAPILNPGQFSFGGQDATPLDPRAEAPLLSTLNLGNPFDFGPVKYSEEILPQGGVPAGY